MERFLRSVAAGDNGCLLWTAGHDARGYGRFWVSGEVLVATRWRLEQHLGRPLGEGLFACHTCDNPPCVEVSHLYEGTHQQNVDDMTGQLRQAWGERNGHHILTESDVIQIRQHAAQGVSRRVLAEAFGVTAPHISGIVTRRAWRNVP